MTGAEIKQCEDVKKNHSIPRRGCDNSHISISLPGPRRHNRKVKMAETPQNLCRIWPVTFLVSLCLGGEFGFALSPPRHQESLDPPWFELPYFPGRILSWYHC